MLPPIMTAAEAGRTLATATPRATRVKMNIFFITFSLKILICLINWTSSFGPLFNGGSDYISAQSMTNKTPYRPRQPRQPLPRSFKDLTPAKHFNPRTFFREMVWKALLTRRIGEHRAPTFPKLAHGQVAITWIGHAS